MVMATAMATMMVMVTTLMMDVDGGGYNSDNDGNVR